jgi:hypothetical protein
MKRVLDGVNIGVLWDEGKNVISPVGEGIWFLSDRYIDPWLMVGKSCHFHCNFPVLQLTG